MRKDIYRVVRRPKSGRTWFSTMQRTKQVAPDTEGEELKEALPTPTKRSKLEGFRVNPLKRFLVRGIGRPWDSVYAEVCARSDPRSFLGAELRRYIRSLVVTTDCWMQDGILMTHNCPGHAVPVKVSTFVRRAGY
jgi:hypothetical protein